MSLLYAGLDVSLEMTSICVIDAEGRMVCETKVISEPEAIASCLLGLSGSFERVGLEADLCPNGFTSAFAMQTFRPSVLRRAIQR